MRRARRQSAPAPGGADRCPAPGAWTNEQAGAHDDTGDVVFDTGGGDRRLPARLLLRRRGVHQHGRRRSLPRSDLGRRQRRLARPVALLNEPRQPGRRRQRGPLHGSAGQRRHRIDQRRRQRRDVELPELLRRVQHRRRPDSCRVGLVVRATASNGAIPAWRRSTAWRRSCPAPRSRASTCSRSPTTSTPSAPTSTSPSPGSGAFTTNDITANPVVWTALGTGIPGGGFCGVQAAVSGGTPTFYAQTGCLGVFESGANRGPFQLWKLVGTGGTWDRVDDNFSATSGIEIFAVDPTNPNRLYASHLSGTEGRADDLLHRRRHHLEGRRRPHRADGRLRRVQDADPRAARPASPASAATCSRASSRSTPRTRTSSWPAAATRASSSRTTAGRTGRCHRPVHLEHVRHPAPAPSVLRLLRPRAGRDVTVFVGTQGRGVWRVRAAAPDGRRRRARTRHREGTDVMLERGRRRATPTASP